MVLVRIIIFYYTWCFLDPTNYKDLHINNETPTLYEILRNMKKNKSEQNELINQKMHVSSYVIKDSEFDKDTRHPPLNKMQHNPSNLKPH